MPFQDGSLCLPSSPKELAGIGQSRHRREDALFLFALLGQPGCPWMGILICRTWGRIQVRMNVCINCASLSGDFKFVTQVLFLDPEALLIS